MDKKSNSIPSLHDPNDDSHGQCYAPVENDKVIVEKKQHFEEGKEIPRGWTEVECDPGCHFRK